MILRSRISKMRVSPSPKQFAVCLPRLAQLRGTARWCLFQCGRPSGICRNTAANHPACKADLWEANKLRWASWSDRTLSADRACSDLGEKGSSGCRWCTGYGAESSWEGFLLFLCGGEERRGLESARSPAKHSFKVSSFFFLLWKRGTG